MDLKDLRRHERLDSANLLAYTCVNQSGDTVDEGMGRTLNISEGGILLEVYKPVDIQDTIHLSIGFRGEILDIKGRTLSCRPDEQGMFHAGIEFFGIDERSLQVLKKFIESIKL